jgi:hypothetical protein
LVFEGTASLVALGEAKKGFEEFKRALFQLVDATKPNITEEPPRVIDVYIRLISPAPHNLRLSYDQLVAKYVSLWSTLEKPEFQHFQTSTPAALTYVMRGVSAFVRTLVLVTLFLSYGLVFVFLGSKPSFTGFLNTPGFNILVAAVCGMLGSVVSILLRLGEFESTRGRSQMFLLLTGATLPFVGGVFGAFVAALLSAKLISIAIAGSDTLNVWLYVVIGFLSGFSERFSRGFVKIAEDRLGGFGGQIPSPATADTVVSGSANRSYSPSAVKNG